MIGTNLYEVITTDLYDEGNGATGTRFRNTPDMGGSVLFPLPIKARGNLYYQSFLVAVDFAINIIKTVGKPVSIGVSLNPNIQKLIRKIINFDITLTPGVLKQINKIISLDNFYNVVVTKRAIFSQIVNLEVTITVEIRKRVQKIINIVVTHDVIIQKQIYRIISIGVSFAVEVLDQFIKLMSINIGSVFLVNVSTLYIPFSISLIRNIARFIGKMEKLITGFKTIGKL